MATIRRKPRESTESSSVHDLFTTGRHRRASSGGSSMAMHNADNPDSPFSTVLSGRRMKRLSARTPEEPIRKEGDMGVRSTAHHSITTSQGNEHRPDTMGHGKKARIMKDAAKAAAVLMGSGRHRSHPSRDGTVTPEPPKKSKSNHLRNSQGMIRGLSGQKSTTTATTPIDITSKGYARATISSARLATVNKAPSSPPPSSETWSVSSSLLSSSKRSTSGRSNITTTTTTTTVRRQSTPSTTTTTTATESTVPLSKSRSNPPCTASNHSQHSSRKANIINQLQTPLIVEALVEEPCTVSSPNDSAISGVLEMEGVLSDSITISERSSSDDLPFLSRENSYSEADTSMSSISTSTTTATTDSCASSLSEIVTTSTNNTEKIRTLTKRPSITDLWMSGVVSRRLEPTPPVVSALSCMSPPASLRTRKSLSQLHSSDNSDCIIEQKQHVIGYHTSSLMSAITTATTTSNTITLSTSPSELHSMPAMSPASKPSTTTTTTTTTTVAGPPRITNPIIEQARPFRSTLPGSRMLHSLFFTRPSPTMPIPTTDMHNNNKHDDMSVRGSTVSGISTSLPTIRLPRMPSFSNSLEALEAGNVKPSSLESNTTTSNTTTTTKPRITIDTMDNQSERHSLRQRLRSPSTTSLISLDESLDAKDALATLHAAVQRQASEQQTSNQILINTEEAMPSLNSSDSIMGLDSDGGIVQMIDFDLDLDDLPSHDFDFTDHHHHHHHHQLERNDIEDDYVMDF
ncbi:hypothetical protein BDF22DRAFT_385461 [Syncephalis plumigaleata]|nr:hypothetical protein BDF22DRAFT_385461 [Syncephalis plumigaleata]